MVDNAAPERSKDIANIENIENIANTENTANTENIKNIEVIVEAIVGKANWESINAQKAIKQAQPRTAPTIDLVIPVYKGFQTTIDCLISVLTSDAFKLTNIIVINDASPDLKLSQTLACFAALKLITLKTNASNLGFVSTVNSGMFVSSNDVILLNSDTLVYANWVERLKNQAIAKARIGTVTPFSNNAALCSYPLIYDDNDFGLEIAGEQIDTLVAKANASQFVEIPTAVGFCMYIKRDCLEDVGAFDAATFGKGYGEENDFCCRASERGWHHLLAGDVYVQHVGSVSFGSDSHQMQRVNTAILNERYPKFLPMVAQWSMIDPASRLRQAADIERLKSKAPNPILFICHDRGGGTERHMRDLADELAKLGQAVIYMRPIDKQKGQLFLESPDIFVPNLNPLDFIKAEDQVTAVLRSLQVKHIHIHSLFDIDPSIITTLPHIASTLGIKYDITLHEYLSICPRTFLIDEKGIYCGEPDLNTCQSCLDNNGSHFGSPSIRKWRQDYLSLLLGARKIFVPDEDVSLRIKRHFPSVTVTVRPHMEISKEADSLNLTFNRTGFSPDAKRGVTSERLLKVALIGVLAQHKGANIIDALCDDIEERKLPIEFVLFGAREERNARQSRHLIELGEYEENDIYDLLKENPCDLALFPAVWPETYSFTLSIALKAGLYPVAFDLGAAASRIKNIGWGSLLPVSLMREPTLINDLLLDLRITSPPPALSQMAKANQYSNILSDYYEFEPSRMHSSLQN